VNRCTVLVALGLGLLQLGTPSVRAATVPLVVGDRMQAAMRFPEDFSGSFNLTSRSLIVKLNGKGPEERLEVKSFFVDRGVTREERLVRLVVNGEEVTNDPNRERPSGLQIGTRPRPSDGASSEQHEVEAEYLLPFDDADLYRLEIAAAADVTVATFSPVAGAGPRDKLVRGRLAWASDSQEPLWLEFSPVENPKRVEELRLRFEFVRTGEARFARQSVRGVGGFLWIKRRFEMETSISDLVPALASCPLSLLLPILSWASPPRDG